MSDEDRDVDIESDVSIIFRLYFTYFRYLLCYNIAVFLTIW